MNATTVFSPRRQPAGNGRRSRGIGMFAQAVAIGYLLCIILLSYNEGLTAYPRAAGALVGVVFIYLSMAGGRAITIPTEFGLLLAWFAYAILCSFAAQFVDVALLRLATLLQIYPLAFALASFIIWNGNSRFYWGGIVFAALLSGAVVLLKPAAFSGDDGRIFGTLSNANTYGMLLSAAFIAVIVTVVAGRNIFFRAICLGLAGFFLYMIARTGSRQGIVVTILAAALVFALFTLRNRRQGAFRLIGSMAMGVGVLGITVLFLASSEYWGRIEKAFQAGTSARIEKADTSLQGRIYLYGKAWSLTLEHPLLGIGPQNFEALQGGRAGIRAGAYTHSNYMDVMVSTGFVGFTLYFAIYWVWWRRLFRLRALIYDPACFAALARAFAIAMVFLIGDFTDVSYYGKMEWLLIAGLIADLRILENYAASAGPAKLKRRAAPARMSPA